MLEQEDVIEIGIDVDIDQLEPSIDELMAMETDEQETEDEDENIEQLMKLKNGEVFAGNKDIHLMYIRDARRYPRLSREDVINLAKRKDAGDRRAWEWLVCCNLLLVVKCARKYVGLGLDLHELIQEGNIGLMRAADGFKHDLGFMFSTYAQWKIKCTIIRAIADKGNVIRLPVHRMTLVVTYRKLQRERLMKSGEELPDELAIETMKISPERLCEIKSDIIQMNSKSLNMPIGEDDAEFGDFIKDENSTDFEFDLDNEKIRSIVNELSDDERRIAWARFVERSSSDVVAEALNIAAWKMGKIEKRIKFLLCMKLKNFRY